MRKFLRALVLAYEVVTDRVVVPVAAVAGVAALWFTFWGLCDILYWMR